MVKTYDPSSYELAEHFLQDESRSDDQQIYKKRCHDLALTIQQAVEDWFLPETGDADLPTANDVRGILRPTCRLCGLEDGACICAHIPASVSSPPTPERGNG